MAVTVTHTFVSPIADESDPNEVGPDEWNAAHTIAGLGTAAEADSTDFATAAQGTLADSALQAADIANMLETGDIGVTVQAWDAQLDSLSTASANGVSLVQAANYAAMKALLDLEIGTDVQAHSAVLDATTASFTTAQETKLGHITVTQAVDLDAIETRVNDLDAAVVLKGSWDASAGTFPGGGTAQAGDSYIVSVAGTVDSVAFALNDRIIAIADNASTTTFAANWFKADYTDQVLSVAGKTGAVTLVAADLTDVTSSAAELNILDGVTATAAELNALDGITATVTELNYTDGVTSAIQTQLDAKLAITAARERLTANRTYYVRTDGSDSNTGLVDSAGGAFLTLQKAWDTVCGLDLGTFTGIIQVNDGTYTAGISSANSPHGGSVTIQGNSGTPANVVIGVTSAQCFSFTGPLAGVVTIKDMKLTAATTGRGIWLQAPGVIQFSNLDFGACVSAHIQCSAPGAKVTCTGNYAVTGNSAVHGIASDHGLLQIESRTVTITGALTFTFWYQSVRLGEILVRSMTYNIGTSVTATEFSVTMNSILDTGGATSGVPGGTAGTTATGGQAA